MAIESSIKNPQDKVPAIRLMDGFGPPAVHLYPNQGLRPLSFEPGRDHKDVFYRLDEVNVKKAWLLDVPISPACYPSNFHLNPGTDGLYLEPTEVDLKPDSPPVHLEPVMFEPGPSLPPLPKAWPPKAFDGDWPLPEPIFYS